MRALFAIAGVLPYALVAFINAFTDLGHKIIIQNTVFKVYDGDVQIVLTAIVNALVLLPYILVFSPAGFLSDRFAKDAIMRYSALFAVFITLGITFCYYQGWFFSAFLLTFVLALQSAIYAPAKYGYIKELVGEANLSAGNALVQATTTVAILSGIIFYSFLFEAKLDGSEATKEDILRTVAPLGWLLVLSSVAEWLFALRLPNKMREQTSREFKLKRYIRGAYLFKNIKIIKRKKEIFDAILALSLFWSISQVVLAIFGEYAKSKLGVTNALAVQGVMALAGVGIVIGSLMASAFSKYYIQTGLSPLGALGIAVIVFAVPSCTSMGLLAVLFLLFGVCAGFLMVPLNSLIQYLSPNVHLGTVLAGNNFVQNIFMFCFLILTSVFAYFGTDATILFYLMGAVGMWLFWLLAKRYSVMGFWAFFELTVSFRYRFHHHGLEHIQGKEAALLLGNHVSWLDWLLLQIPLAKRIRFMMDKNIYKWRFFHPVLKKGEVIPISSKASKEGFVEAIKRLQEGNIVAIFPEGQIARSGELGKFYKGYELIASRYHGEIVPFFIGGMEGSLFARYKSKRPWHVRRDVHLYFGEPLSINTPAEELKGVIQKMKETYESEKNREVK